MIIELEGKLLTQATIIARLKGVELEKYVKKCVVKDVEESKNDLFRLFEEPRVAVVEEEPDEVKSPVHITVNRYDMDGPVQAYSTATPFNELYIDGESTHLNLQEAKNIVATIHDKGNWIKCMYSFIEERGCRAIDVLPEHVMFICADNKSKSLISLLKIGGGEF